MKTTIEVSDDLYRRAKAEAALRGQRMRDLVEEGLRRVLDMPPQSNQPRASMAEMIKDVEGMFDSGIPDLASNPKHMEGFGRDAFRDP